MTAPTLLDLADRIARRPGYDAPSPRWRATLAFFAGLPLTDTDVTELAAATRRTPAGIRARSGRPFSELWCRVGRRGRKSSTAALIALHEACFAGHDAHLMPGERGLVAIVSRDIAGSTVVARMLESFASALGIGCRWTSMGSVRLLELDGFAFSVACLPCSATAPRGYAIAVLIVDEIAHWPTDEAEFTDADTAVVGAVKPAMAQFPRARLIAISSPLGRQGLHYDTVERALGDHAHDDVLAVEGPTWIWSPDISEARTHELERDARIHAREFAAIPQDGISQAFSSALVEPIFRPPPKLSEISYHPPVLPIDASGGSKCEFASALAAWGNPRPIGEPLDLPGGPRIDEHGRDVSSFFEYDDRGVPLRDARGRAIAKPGVDLRRQPLLYVARMSGFSEWGGRMGFKDVVEQLAIKMIEGGARVAVGDDYMGPALESEFRRHGLRFFAIPTSNSNKNAAIKRLRMLMAGRNLLSDEDALTKSQLVDYREHITGSGAVVYSAKPGSLADRVSVLVNLIIGEAAGHLPGSPAGTDNRRAGMPAEGLG